MNNYLSLSVLISVLYFIIRYLERKIRKEELHMKQLLKDTLLVYLCVFIGNVIYENIAPLADGVSKQATYVFTDEPGF
jgi:hypothetical protein